MVGIKKLPSGETFTRGGIDRAGKAFAENSQNIADLQSYRAFRLSCVNTSLSILGKAGLPERAFIGIRLKRLDSIRRKLTRKNTNFKLSQIDDIIGIRLICSSLNDVYAVRDSIKQQPEHLKEKDYTQEQHSLDTGYRSVHHIMQFDQRLFDNQKIKVRFEIQVRSYYQHQWAVWSEKYGENIKRGGGDNRTEAEQKIIDELNSLSEHIKKWEINNPSVPQDSGILPPCHDNQRIATVWKQPDGINITHRIFHSSESAIQQLNYWENKFPHSRNNALLLIGIADKEKLLKVLNATHPLYVTGNVPNPKNTMPDIFK